MTHRLKTSLTVAAAIVAAVLAAIALTLWPRPAHGAGTVEVSFANPDQYADIGRSSVDRERVLRSLQQHFETFAARLPDAQTLRVEVLDVNLAGEPDPFRIEETRILRGRADWPQVHLRWSLDEAGRSVKGGDERVADMHYFFNVRNADRYGDLPYEKRMLDAWFAEKVLAVAR
jgi:hypothetical protein